LYLFPVVPLRIVGQVELDRPITFNDTRLVDGVTTEVSFFRPTGKLRTSIVLIKYSTFLFLVKENGRRTHSIQAGDRFCRSSRVS
jgi:hypothetical protein